MMRAAGVTVLAVGLVLAVASPAPAAAARCGTVAGVGDGTTVTKVSASGVTCLTAKTLAKKFARTRVAPVGFVCRETFTAATAASVACRRPGRTVTFRVRWTGAMPLPAAPALPSAGGA